MSSTSATVSGSGCKIKNTTYERRRIQFQFVRKNHVPLSLYGHYLNNDTSALQIEDSMHIIITTANCLLSSLAM
jgi:hypothetical protein